MRLISAHAKPLLDAWRDTALNTPHVARFLSTSCWLDTAANPGDGWTRVSYLSDDGSTWLCLVLDRDVRTEASIGIWGLHRDRQRRALQAGRMLHALPAILLGLGVHAVQSQVHASNGESLALHRRRFGAPWGVKPEGAWDPMFGRYVDLVHFRAEVGQGLAPARRLRM